MSQSGPPRTGPGQDTFYVDQTVTKDLESAHTTAALLFSQNHDTITVIGGSGDNSVLRTSAFSEI
jgi:hypothetical protein